MATLSASDHRRVLDVLWTAYAGEQVDLLPESTLVALQSLIPSTIVGYHGSPGASVIFDRGGRDFSERDRAVLEALGPHLALIRRRNREQAIGASENEATSSLTPREREVVDLVARGWANGEIGAALFISTGTVRKHLDNIYAKLGVRSRAQAVAVTARGSSTV